MQIMKKILIISLGLVAVLSAGTCLDQNDIYTFGYKAGCTEKGSKDILLSNTLLSSRCEGNCRARIMTGKNISLDACYNLCISAAQDGFKGAKSKVKLCE